MEKRELLEKAAAIAGLELGWWDEERECIYYRFSTDMTDSHYWDPIDDDGDAFRLMVKFSCYPAFAFKGAPEPIFCTDEVVSILIAEREVRVSDFGGDVRAAARYAIVEAVVAFGG